MSPAKPLLLFYPTSPAHVRDFLPLRDRLGHWRTLAIVHPPLARISPGIEVALADCGVPVLSVGAGMSLPHALPKDTTVLLLGAVFEPFALDLFAWAMQHGIAVAAVEEVAQLGLNQADINNYDAPFDRLFVASPDERDRFLSLGYPTDMVRVSGLPAYERIDATVRSAPDAIRRLLGLANDERPIVYTTSPLRSRLAIHNKDGPRDREAMLAALAEAGRRAGRRLVVKLHPNEDRTAVRQAVKRICPVATVVGREIAIDELLRVAAVLVNRGNSQTCLEAILRGVPTVVAACGLRTLFHDESGIPIAETPQALPELVLRALEAGPTVSEAFRTRHIRLPSQGVANYLAGEIESLAAARSLKDETGWNWLVRSTLFVGGHERALRLIREARLGGKWQLTVARALDAHLAGERQAAIAAWRDSLPLDPGWFFPHYELAHGLLAEDQPEAASEHARQSIALHPPFHGLWHELPMRVILMRSFRMLGNHAAAAAELAALEQRGLVELMPELLLEKAAQLGRNPDGISSAADALARALEVLDTCPVSLALDGQYRDTAIGDLEALATRAEELRRHDDARHCLETLELLLPDDPWRRFRLARATLGTHAWSRAIRLLVSLTAWPGAPHAVALKALPSPVAERLLALWPGTPGGPSRQVALLAESLTCAVRTRRANPADWANPVSIGLLIWLFVFRHWLRPLRSRNRRL